FQIKLSSHPVIAPLKTIYAEFILFILKKAAALNRAINQLLQSIKTSAPNFIPTMNITAIALTFTASRNTENIFEFLSFGTMGFTIKTKINEGRKIPAVAINAPLIPDNW